MSEPPSRFQQNKKRQYPQWRGCSAICQWQLGIGQRKFCWLARIVKGLPTKLIMLGTICGLRGQVHLSEAGVMADFVVSLPQDGCERSYVV